MTESEFYQKVFDFAAHAHDQRALKPENRFRKGTGLPYITHPVAVKELAVVRAQEAYLPAEAPRKVFLISLVALLHDVLEDTTVEEPELIQLLMSDNFLDLSEINQVVDAVKLLTKDMENFDIIEYLNRIKQVFFARTVKLADLQHNMSDLKPGNLLDKYTLSYCFLLV